MESSSGEGPNNWLRAKHFSRRLLHIRIKRSNAANCQVLEYTKSNSILSVEVIHHISGQNKPVRYPSFMTDYPADLHKVRLPACRIIQMPVACLELVQDSYVEWDPGILDRFVAAVIGISQAYTTKRFWGFGDSIRSVQLWSAQKLSKIIMSFKEIHQYQNEFTDKYGMYQNECPRALCASDDDDDLRALPAG